MLASQGRSYPIRTQITKRKVIRISQADFPTSETKTAIAQLAGLPRCGVRSWLTARTPITIQPSATHEPRRNKWLEVYFHLCFFAAVASCVFRKGSSTRLISSQVSKTKDGLKMWFWQALVAQLLTFRQDLWRRCLRASAGAAVRKRAGLGLLGGFGGFHVSCQASLTWRLTSFPRYLRQESIGGWRRQTTFGEERISI